MSGPVLRPVEWAQRQLGHRHARTTRAWLARRGVRVIRGRLLESAFYEIWGPRIDFAAVDEALRS